MIRFISIIVSILICTVNVFGQSSSLLQGTVTDENGEVVMFATVKLQKDGASITGTQTDFDGEYLFNNLGEGTYDLVVSYVGYQTKKITDVIILEGKSLIIDVEISQGIDLAEIVVTYKIPLIEQDHTSSGSVVTSKEIDKLGSKNKELIVRGSRSNGTDYYIDGIRVSGSSTTQNTPNNSTNGYLNQEKKQVLKKAESNNESYALIEENPFKVVTQEPLSTFSIDVDKASYSNVRRFITNGIKPPKDAVRIEEMINYFDYDYPEPKDKHPIIVHTEMGDCPWNKKHQIVKVGLKAKDIPKDKLPYSNIVFLLDVSGSMSDDLELVKAAIKILVEELREGDKISIVVYAGAAGLVLPATDGSQKQKIINALDKLKSGGGTAGGQGILLAYKIAKENFIKAGNNRIILATDGDFNIGMSSNRAMTNLIVEKRKSGIYLTCLGFGIGNYQDSKMEILADKGNGNYAYIDSKKEAIKIFKTEFCGTMFTVAKDVKFQLEFNPTKVAAYRLIGYENRLLAAADFNDDSKDAGEIGLGHTVTALYEIIPTDTKSEFLPKIELLKYQNKNTINNENTAEVLTVKLRYKPLDNSKSIKIEYPVTYEKVKKNSADFNFSTSVALFGMLLRTSKYVKNGNYDLVLQLAKNNKGIDSKGYREDFIEMVTKVNDSVESLETETDGE